MSASCLCCRFEQLFTQLLDQLQPVCTSERRFLTSFFHFQKPVEPDTLERDPDVSRCVCVCVGVGGGIGGEGFRLSLSIPEFLNIRLHSTISSMYNSH